MNFDRLRHIVRMNVGERCPTPNCRACARGIRERDALLAAIDVVEETSKTLLNFPPALAKLQEKLENLK